MSSTDVSVVIPCFNGASTLHHQLDALCRQTISVDWEIVVVDNGSTDDSAEVARSYGDRIPIRVTTACERHDRAYACNAGAAVARGAKLVFIDADDVVGDGYVPAMAAALDAHEFVVGRIDLDRLNPEPWIRGTRDLAQHDGLPRWFGWLRYGTGCAHGLRREAFERLDGYTEDVPMAEDIDLCFRAQLEGVELGFVGDAVVHYRIRRTLRALYRQGRGYGEGQAALYARHAAHGMPARSVSDGLRDWSWTCYDLCVIWRRRSRYRAAHFLGYRVGRLRGSRRFGVIYM